MERALRVNSDKFLQASFRDWQMNNLNSNSGISPSVGSTTDSTFQFSQYSTGHQPNRFQTSNSFQSLSSNSNLGQNSMSWIQTETPMNQQPTQQPQNLDFHFGRQPQPAAEIRAEPQSGYLLPNSRLYPSQSKLTPLSRQNSGIQNNSVAFQSSSLLPQEQPKVISRKPSFNVDEANTNSRNPHPIQRWTNFTPLQPLQTEGPQEIQIPRLIQMTSNRSIKSPVFSTQHLDAAPKNDGGYSRQVQDTKKSYIELQNNNYEAPTYVQFANLSNSVIYNQNKPRNAPGPTSNQYFTTDQYQPQLGLTQAQFNPVSNVNFKPFEQNQPNVYGLPTARPAPSPEVHLIGVSQLIEKLQDNGKFSARGARSPEPRARAETAPFGQQMNQTPTGHGNYLHLGHQPAYMNQIPQQHPQYSFPHRY